MRARSSVPSAQGLFYVNRRWNGGSVAFMTIQLRTRRDESKASHTRLWLRLGAALVLGTTAALSSGCLLLAAGAAGAGTVAYVRGELKASLGHDLSATMRATGRAIEQLKFVKISERADALSANYTLRTAQDKKIEVELTKVGDVLTQVEIRVGVFGDEKVAMTILDKIKVNL